MLCSRAVRQRARESTMGGNANDATVSGAPAGSSSLVGRRNVRSLATSLRE